MEALLIAADREAQAYYTGGSSPDARAYAESAVGLSATRSATSAQILSVSSCAASAAADQQPDRDYDRVYDAARVAELAAQAELLRGIVGTPPE